MRRLYATLLALTLSPGLAACADDGYAGGLPAAPTELRAVLAPAGGVTLTWTDASDDEDGFVVERLAEGAGTSFATLTQVGENVVTYTDMTAASGKGYRYRVQAVNGYGEAASNEAAVTVP